MCLGCRIAADDNAERAQKSADDLNAVAMLDKLDELAAALGLPSTAECRAKEAERLRNLPAMYTRAEIMDMAEGQGRR
jgi:hypothetical protein